ncbi:MAG: transposase [Caldilineaceae bacterium]
MSAIAWSTKQFKQYDLREQFGLSAQAAVRVIAKVAEAYKLDKKTQREFRLLGSIAYDDRILAWKLDKSVVSIWTLDGRLAIPFVAGAHNQKRLATLKGEADLILRNGSFYLYQTCDAEEEASEQPSAFLGVDLGIVNIATTSDGETFSGERVEATRIWHDKRKATLQSVGTLSAKRRLRKLSGRQRRFQKDTNHKISKSIVSKAKDTHRGIALGELGGIRERVLVIPRKLAPSVVTAKRQIALRVTNSCVVIAGTLPQPITTRR